MYSFYFLLYLYIFFFVCLICFAFNLNIGFWRDLQRELSVLMTLHRGRAAERCRGDAAETFTRCQRASQGWKCLNKQKRPRCSLILSQKQRVWRRSAGHTLCLLACMLYLTKTALATAEATRANMALLNPRSCTHILNHIALQKKRECTRSPP